MAPMGEGVSGFPRRGEEGLRGRVRTRGVTSGTMGL